MYFGARVTNGYVIFAVQGTFTSADSASGSVNKMQVSGYSVTLFADDWVPLRDVNGEPAKATVRNTCI